METAKKKLPILTWLPKYTRGKFVGDVIAGTTVGLTVVPQSIAYAAIAGLPPQYGLYSAYVGSFVYTLLGPTKQICIGPTAVMALLTYETCGNSFPECAVLTAFYSGIIESLMAIFRLGCLIKFISEPVTAGFTNAAALTIASSQLSNLLGLQGKRGSGFVGYCVSLVGSISTMQLADVTVGFLTILTLLALNNIEAVRFIRKSRQAVVQNIAWVVAVSRNIICLLLSSLVAFLWHYPPFRLTGDVASGMPAVAVPSFKLPHVQSEAGNSTVAMMGFIESVKFVGTGPLTIAAIAVLQNVAISKTFNNRKAIDGSQEMAALGVSNILGGFVQAMPVSGSFSRSAVCQASGVRTPAAGIYTGLIVILALNFLTPSFHYIPKASLAAVVICAVFQTVNFDICWQIWTISKLDFIVNVVTFLGCLCLGMEYGIFLGVLVNMATLLTATARAALQHEMIVDRKTGRRVLLILPASGGRFLSADYIRSTVAKLAEEQSPEIVLLDFKLWNDWDYTSAFMFSSLYQEMTASGRVLLFLNCSPEWKLAVENAGVDGKAIRFNDDGAVGSLSDAIRSRRPSYVDSRNYAVV